MIKLKTHWQGQSLESADYTSETTTQVWQQGMGWLHTFEAQMAHYEISKCHVHIQLNEHMEWKLKGNYVLHQRIKHFRMKVQGQK